MRSKQSLPCEPCSSYRRKLRSCMSECKRGTAPPLCRSQTQTTGTMLQRVTKRRIESTDRRIAGRRCKPHRGTSKRRWQLCTSSTRTAEMHTRTCLQHTRPLAELLLAQAALHRTCHRGDRSTIWAPSASSSWKSARRATCAVSLQTVGHTACRRSASMPARQLCLSYTSKSAVRQAHRPACTLHGEASLLPRSAPPPFPSACRAL
jgi:hypothetical protein